MPKPSEVHTSRAMENILIANLQEQQDFVAGNVFPFVPVDNESGTYYIYDIGDTARNEVKERAPSTESVGIDWVPTTDTFTCKEYMVHHDVDDRVANNADAGMEQRESVGLLLTEQMLTFFELVFAATYYQTSTWTGSSTGADITPSIKWDNASGVPVTNVRAQAAAMKRKTKKRPNVFITTPDVDAVLRENAQVIAMMPSTSWKDPTNADMAKLFQVEKYIVAEASYNSAAKGAATSMANIYGGDHALLCYANPAPSRFAPSAGYCFIPTTYGGNNWGLKAWEYYIDTIHSTRYEHGMLGAMKLVAATMGVFFDGVLT